MKNFLKLLLLSSLLSSVVYAKNHIVDQKNKTFIPHHISVKVGDTITFKNSDDFAHNVYTDDEDNEFDIGMQAAGTSSTVEIKAAGKFIVECAIHPNMLLEVTVTEE